MEKQIILILLFFLSSCGYKIVDKKQLDIVTYYTASKENSNCFYLVLNSKLSKEEKGYLLRTSQRSFDLQVRNLYEKKLKECKEDNICKK